MKAASGIIHSEMPRQAQGLRRGVQLWINLPAREKMDQPTHRECPPERFPVLETGGTRVKLLTGEYEGRRSPIEDANTQVRYVYVTLAGGRSFPLAVAASDAAFLFVFEGEAR